jgi:hypothetical protein
MIEVYGATLACAAEIMRGMLVRWLAGFHAIVDVGCIEDAAVRLWLNDGSTITLGLSGLVEVARWANRQHSMSKRQSRVGLVGAASLDCFLAASDNCGAEISSTFTRILMRVKISTRRDPRFAALTSINLMTLPIGFLKHGVQTPS